MNIPNNEQVTPLHLAAARSSPDIAHLLIKKGAEIDAIDFDNWAPIHEAIVHNKLENVCMLLYYNADLSIRTDNNNLSPLMMAVMSFGSINIIKALLEYCDDFEEKCNNEWTLLYHAIRTECVPIAKEMVLRGADVNYINPHAIRTNNDDLGSNSTL